MKLPAWKTKVGKLYQLKENDIFIMNDKEYICTANKHGLIFFVDAGNPNQRSRFISDMDTRIIEIYLK